MGFFVELFTPSTVEAAAPLVELATDYGLDRVFGNLSKEIINDRLKNDDQAAIKALAANDDIVATLETYGNSRDRIAMVLRTSVLALIGIALSQYETTGSILCWSPIHFGLATFTIFFIAFFLVNLSRRRIEPAKVKAAVWYRRTALGLCIIVLILSHIPDRFIPGIRAIHSATSGK
jgi:hypothetical protein